MISFSNKRSIIWKNWLTRLLLVWFGNALLSTALAATIKIDQYSRLVEYPDKVELVCPKQDKDTAVFLVIGQSNAANHGEKKFITHYPNQVFAYFNGKCFVAASPLLGASGIDGEFLTPMADELIREGAYKKILLVPSAIGGTPIKRWQKGGDLNAMLVNTLAELKPKFRLTGVIWHQGESDFVEKTSSEQYKEKFNSLIETIRGRDSLPPVFYAIATLCGHNPEWKASNPVALAQRSLANSKHHIYLGANTDQFLLIADRDFAYCHFSESGLLKTAAAFAKAIQQSAKVNNRSD